MIKQIMSIQPGNPLACSIYGKPAFYFKFSEGHQAVQLEDGMSGARILLTVDKITKGYLCVFTHQFGFRIAHKIPITAILPATGTSTAQ